MIPIGIMQGQTAINDPGIIPPLLLGKLDAWWDAQETGTNTRVDSHGSHDIAGFVDGAGGIDTGTALGNAMYFDGNSQAQTTPTGWPVTPQSFAASFFVHPITRLDYDHCIWKCGSTASGSYVPGDFNFGISGDNMFMQISSDGSYNDGDGDTVQTDTNVVVAGTTHWAYCHYNVNNNEMAVSVDNGPLYTHTLSHTFFNAGNCLRFGRMTESYPHGLHGWLARLNYWTAPLTADERTWLFNSGNGRLYGEISN